MKRGEFVLLLSDRDHYLVRVEDRKLNTATGILDLSKLKKKKYGDVIKTHKGKEYTVLRPTLIDMFEKIMKRVPQIITPKDAAMILAETGLRNDSVVIDAGTGSGFLAMFLANYLSKGKVISYEKNEDFIRVAEENVKQAGLKNIVLKKKDVRKGFDEKDVDMVVLDLKQPEKVVDHAYSSLKTGGFLVVYSPTVEEMLKVVKKMKKLGFRIKIVENIVREWQSLKTTRPKTLGVMHTGFLIFGRKVK